MTKSPIPWLPTNHINMDDKSEITEKDVEVASWPAELLRDRVGGIVIIPDVFSGDQNIYTSTAESTLKVLKQAGAVVEIHDKNRPLMMRDNRSVEWIAPTLFVSQLYLSQ